MVLVFLGQEHRGRSATGFGDDPESHPGLGVINREEAKTVLKAEFVLLPVVFVYIAPIAIRMAGKGGEHFLGRHFGECARRGEQPSDGEFRIHSR